MLWCKHCKKAVAEPQEHVTYDIPNPNVGGFEKIKTYHCPDCGKEAYLQAGCCVMCGEYTAPGKSLCSNCYTEIDTAITLVLMQLDLPLNKVLDGVAEYLDMKG